MRKFRVFFPFALSFWAAVYDTLNLDICFLLQATKSQLLLLQSALDTVFSSRAFDFFFRRLCFPPTLCLVKLWLCPQKAAVSPNVVCVAIPPGRTSVSPHPVARGTPFGAVSASLQQGQVALTFTLHRHNDPSSPVKASLGAILSSLHADYIFQDGSSNISHPLCSSGL